jgi:hypothetical protein
MSLVVGVDIGNSTTEACAAEIGRDGQVRYLSQALARTSGVKGTTENVAGAAGVVHRALAGACHAGPPRVAAAHATSMQRAAPYPASHIACAGFTPARPRR